MLFTQRFWPGLRDGSITVTFRRWQRPQAVAGRRYRTPVGLIEVTAIDVVDPAAITDDDARRAGHASADELRADLPGRDGLDVVRIAFFVVDEPDPRAVLAATDHVDPAARADLDRRLARLDAASPTGPWTAATLALIGRSEGVVSSALADELGRERAGLKLDIAKLKALGLTESLGTGYRLSPRGRAYLAG